MNEELKEKLYRKMMAYDAGDPTRIQHFVKVHSFAHIIGKAENLEEETQSILECAALVHDIGIKPAEEKYGKSDGKLQEQEGPAQAEKMMKELGFEEKVIERVSYLVGHAVFGENLVQLLAGLVAVGGAGLLRHLDAAVGHEGTLER